MVSGINRKLTTIAAMLPRDVSISRKIPDLSAAKTRTLREDLESKVIPEGQFGILNVPTSCIS